MLWANLSDLSKAKRPGVNSLDLPKPYQPLWLHTTQRTPFPHIFTLPTRVVHSQGEKHFLLWPQHTHRINKQKKVEACQTFTSLPLPRLSLCPPAPVAPSPQSTLIRKTHNKQMLYISEQEKSTSFVFQLHFKDTGQKQQSFSKMWNRHSTHPTSWY